MRRIIQLIDLEDVALILGLGLLCSGLALMHVPSALMLAGSLILAPRFLKYVPRGTGRKRER